MTDANTVLLERDAETGVATITLNRPDQLNAMSGELIDRFGEVMRELEVDRSVGCVVLTGAGRGFCSGGDVGGMQQRDAASNTPREPGTDLEHWEDAAAAAWRMHRDVTLPFYRLPIPTVALVNGPAAGAGFSLACGADIRIAAEGAFFTTAFGRIGRSGDFGGTFLIRQLLGPARARELYFTSARVDAQTALDWGLVNYVYSAERLLPEGIALAARIAAGPRRAHARMKRVFEAADAHDFERVLELESMYMTLSGRSAEGRKFLAAFQAERSKR